MRRSRLDPTLDQPERGECGGQTRSTGGRTPGGEAGGAATRPSDSRIGGGACSFDFARRASFAWKPEGRGTRDALVVRYRVLDDAGRRHADSCPPGGVFVADRDSFLHTLAGYVQAAERRAALEAEAPPLPGGGR